MNLDVSETALLNDAVCLGTVMNKCTEFGIM